MAANNPLPPLSAKAVPGATPGAARRKPAGKLPAWALKLGTLFTTFTIFAGSFGYATAHLYATNAPLQPATVAASGTTTLTSTVRTTTQTAITTTRHS